MVDFSDIDADNVAVSFELLGDAAVLDDGHGGRIETRGLLYEETRVIGEFGVTLDPRASVELPVADVGAYPQGTLTIAGGRYTLGRPVDSPAVTRRPEGRQNGDVVILWVDPL